MSKLHDAAAQLGLGPEDLIPYGHDLAKIPRSILDRPATGKGKLVLVSAMTPTPAGEGKTTTSIGIVQGLTRIGEKACAALREPSLGPCFGIKGGGTGGGRSMLEPSVKINLHCTGDLHAVTAAHNLLSAIVDKHLHFHQEPRIDPRKVVWKRVLDVNDRALRGMLVGTGGEGQVRETGFDITAASEVMAALCLAESVDDMRERLARIIVAFDEDRKPVTAGDLKASGAMLALLREAMDPNLVHTTEGAPAIIHGGPFANIAHGCNSVIATRMALHLSDWVITEAGFGFDLGAEKFVHVKCRTADLQPQACVIVATVRALKYHGGLDMKQLPEPNVGAISAGFPNLTKHVESARAMGLRPLVAINRRFDDADEEIAEVIRLCTEFGVQCVASDHFAEGGAGAEDLARALVALVDSEPAPPLNFLYELDAPLQKKVEAVARTVYGASAVRFERKALLQLGRIKRLGLESLPVCMSKTQSSLSDDATRRGRPEGFTITVRELEIAAGAGFIVALTGKLVRMPGLGRRPQSENVDLVDGEIVGIG